MDEPVVDPVDEEYLRLNRAMWDGRADAHAASADYAVRRLLDDPTAVSDVVAFDRSRLGDLTDVRGVHLQCHIGTDTLSLTRLGARMTGLDLSPASVAQARRLASEAGVELDVHEAEVYAAADVLGRGAFDLVYTGIGALCWLPSVERWARTVADLLAPGGRLFIREGHPVLWALDYERDDDLLALAFPYFETDEPNVWTEGGTYVKTDVELPPRTTHEWNHGLAEIVAAVLGAGLRLTALEEHRSVPWRAMDQMELDPDAGPGEWALPAAARNHAPLTYTLQAVKDG